MHFEKFSHKFTYIIRLKKTKFQQYFSIIIWFIFIIYNVLPLTIAYCLTVPYTYLDKYLLHYWGSLAFQIQCIHCHTQWLIKWRVSVDCHPWFRWWRIIIAYTATCFYLSQWSTMVSWYLRTNVSEILVEITILCVQKCISKYRLLDGCLLYSLQYANARKTVVSRGFHLIMQSKYLSANTIHQYLTILSGDY